jgi:hypothetical protein
MTEQKVCALVGSVVPLRLVVPSDCADAMLADAQRACDNHISAAPCLFMGPVYTWTAVVPPAQREGECHRVRMATITLSMLTGAPALCQGQSFG